MTAASSWNLTLSDSSPLFKYAPFGDGAAGDGWATHYSVSGFRQAGGATPLGESSHITWNNRSRQGDTYMVKRNAHMTSYLTTFGPDTGLLVSFSSTFMRQHNITVIPYANGPNNSFALDKAILVMQSSSGEPSSTDMYDNRNSSISYGGSWSVLSDKSIPSTTSPAPYHETEVGGSNATLEFQGEGMMICATLNWGHGLYQVSLDDTSSQIYNASAWWIVGDTPLFFQAGLDPNKTHKVTLTNMGYDAGMSTIDLNSITVFGSIPNPILNPGISKVVRPRSVPTEVIVGAAVGSIVAAVLILALLVFLYLRRRSVNRDKSMHPFSPGKNKEYMVDPFLSDRNPPGYLQQSTTSARTIQSNVKKIERSRVHLSRPSETSATGESSSALDRDGTGQRVILDYGLLAEHVVARLPSARPIGNGKHIPPEYTPPNVSD